MGNKQQSQIAILHDTSNVFSGSFLKIGLGVWRVIDHVSHVLDNLYTVSAYYIIRSGESFQMVHVCLIMCQYQHVVECCNYLLFAVW